MNTTKKLHEVIAKALTVPVTEVSDELEYQGIPEWDSLTHLTLVSELENNYNVAIEMEDILEMGSVTKVKETLKKYGVEIV